MVKTKASLSPNDHILDHKSGKENKATPGTTRQDISIVNIWVNVREWLIKRHMDKAQWIALQRRALKQKYERDLEEKFRNISFFSPEFWAKQKAIHSLLASISFLQFKTIQGGSQINKFFFSEILKGEKSTTSWSWTKWNKIWTGLIMKAWLDSYMKPTTTVTFIQWASWWVFGYSRFAETSQISLCPMALYFTWRDEPTFQAHLNVLVQRERDRERTWRMSTKLYHWRLYERIYTICTYIIRNFVELSGLKTDAKRPNLD